MRRSRPEPRRTAARGLTLIEMVVAMVVLAIVVALVAYFANPVRQAVDIAVRAELTDVADNALQRISREVRLALPNSVRVRTLVTGEQYLEFLPVVTAGRYRADPAGSGAGTACPDGDDLAFGVPETCFKSLGPIINGAAVTGSDFVVLNNYGNGFANQDAYLDSTSNRRGIDTATVETAPDRQRITLDAGAFDPALHDSPGKRFYVVSGNGTDLLPVTYECAGGALRRWSGYSRAQVQPVTFPAGTDRLLATRVAGCSFQYAANLLAPQVGLLTLRLTLSAPRSDPASGNETVSLYQAVHVVNVP